jgi:hypothetical protein
MDTHEHFFVKLYKNIDTLEVNSSKYVLIFSSSRVNMAIVLICEVSTILAQFIEWFCVSYGD